MKFEVNQQIDNYDTTGQGNIQIVNSFIGSDTRIYNFVNIYDSIIGNNCVISAFVEIGKARIGHNVAIQKGCSIPNGTIIEDNVFLAPQVTLTNDRYPKSHNLDWKCEPIIIKKGASIGANATIIPGIIIAENTLVGAGAVVTKHTEEYGIYVGNPAKKIGDIRK